MTGPTLRSAGIRNVQFGANVTVVEPVNIYDCTIGDSTFVGPFVEIQRGVIIGQTLQNSVTRLHLRTR